jgi:hypothetical protein
MIRTTNQVIGSGEICAIDRRRSARPRRSIHNVQIVRKLMNGIVFQVGWQFPVPASRRRFYLSKKEMMVEEIGKIPGKDIFQFAGIFLKKMQKE